MVSMIITEKPSSALKIAQALSDGKLEKKAVNKVTYYELHHKGKKVIIGCAVGHLYNLREKDKKGWTYPVYETEWAPSYELSKASAYTKKYVELLSKLASQADEFIVATDYDLEGSLIGFNIIRFICNKKDGKRMKFSTLTKDELQESFENASHHLDFNLIESGEARHVVDWVYGINLSRALTLAIKHASNRFKILSSGRVQGPSLKILAERELEIQKFKPEPFWELIVLAEQGVEAIHEKQPFFNKEHAHKIHEKIKHEKLAIVKEVKKHEFLQEPPHPFDLTSLQLEAYRCFKIQPKHTLELSQSLYTNAYISYPRTSSHQLPEALNLKKIIHDLSKQEKYSALCNELLKTELKPNNGKKTDPAHPCFTEDTTVKFNNSDINFKSLIKGIKKWNIDEGKGSYYKDIIFNKVYSYNHKKGEIIKGKGYRIWKTPLQGNLVNLYVKNKKIKTTDNHEFYALHKSGLSYVKVGELREGDYLFYKQDESKELSPPDISQEHISNAFSIKHRKEIKQGTNKRMIKVNKEIERFFKNCSREDVKKLAQITGFCMGDGHISFTKPTENREEYPSISFIGQKEDMELLRNDILSLGFSSYLMKKNKNYYYLNNKGMLGRILIALECPRGDKVATSFSIPKWIQDSDKDIKIHFLRGLFGAELTKTRIHHYNKRDIRSYAFAQNKIKDLESSFNNYLLQLKEVLSELEIETSEIKIRNKIIRKKDNKQTIEGRFEINNARNNLIKFLSRVGYAYCNYKEKLARKALSYLIFKDLQINQKQTLRGLAIEIYKKVIKKYKLIKKEQTYKEIAKKLNVSDKTVKGWIAYNKGEKENHVSINDIPPFDEFGAIIPKGLIPYRLDKKENSYYKGFVYDLEIRATHNYFVEGFLTHNCIHPTGIQPEGLNKQEEEIYDLIVRRILATFAQPAKRETLTIHLDIKEEPFLAQGTRTLDKQWHHYYGRFAKFKEKELPALKQGEKIKIEKLQFIDKETQPPKRYTAASIIKEMEKKGLGTKATRAAIIDSLYQRNYIWENSIQVTTLGMKTIETLDKYCPEILDVKMTKSLEKDMEKIREGKETKEKVISHAKKDLTKILNHFKENEIKIGKALTISYEETQKQESIIGNCNLCKGELRILFSRKNRSYFVACNNYPKCTNTFSLPQYSLPKPTGEQCEECKYPLVLIIKKSKRPFKYCINKECPLKKKWFEEMKKKDHEEALEAKAHEKLHEHAKAKSHQEPIKKERKKEEKVKKERNKKNVSKK